VVALLEAQAKTGGYAVVEHPEDLGVRKLGDPGSIWRWPGVRALVDEESWRSGALLQSEWGRTFAKPTRFLYYLPGFEDILKDGWPIFDEAGVYQGPLGRSKVEMELIGKKGEEFTTLGAAAWPSQLCEALAELIWKAWIGSNLEVGAPSDREERGFGEKDDIVMEKGGTMMKEGGVVKNDIVMVKAGIVEKVSINEKDSAEGMVKEGIGVMNKEKGFSGGGSGSRAGGRRKLSDEDARRIKDGRLEDWEIYIGRGHAFE
jgi:hypothetical protein